MTIGSQHVPLVKQFLLEPLKGEELHRSRPSIESINKTKQKQELSHKNQVKSMFDQTFHHNTKNKEIF
jgi:hypothetical protein